MYPPWEDWSDEHYVDVESFEEHYGDEIEDRVIYAMEPESIEPTVQQQLTLWAAY